MKSLIRVLSLAVLFTVATMSTAANAEQKIGVVNVQAVLANLPQVATIEQNINAEFADQMQEVQRLRADGNFLVEKLQREEATMSEAQIKELQAQINDIGQQLQQKGQPLQQNMQRRSQEERDKLLGLIGQAIQAIADSGKYDLILNATAVPFAGEEFNITQEVLDRVSKAN
ncbi:OmpH family outer membrane protein [Glaciecola petra]|uniref:OmpH family outer membrane protein n=1 Tax=Glaciecola petra TaxID=3075602 RepID=A0ABU2ZQ15_9ALTE|nr:OmpH family outer membrane protein [Aestuariibacter sp. P117]MDT0593704.1 OmpH family outer membrane protein [Aestuariibacter sp. P117]